MRQGQIDVPNVVPNIYNVQAKTGGRTEYAITVTDELSSIGNKFTDMPLVYASIVVAKPGLVDQDFHADSASGQRAIIYLTDVDRDSGPIEFENGPVLGAAGTYAFYNANEIHRGSKSATDRYALALAFDDYSKNITTIGATPVSCNDIYCDDGFVKRVDLPTSQPFNNETCCTQNQNTKTILILMAIFFLVFYITFA
jgi:hypothetical protein